MLNSNYPKTQASIASVRSRRHFNTGHHLLLLTGALAFCRSLLLPVLKYQGKLSQVEMNERMYEKYPEAEES